MTLGRATRSVAMRICSGQVADEGLATAWSTVSMGCSRQGLAEGTAGGVEEGQPEAEGTQ